jgi:hypothetical protein
MSTLITTNLKHTSSSTNNLVLNSNGTVTGAGKILQVVQAVKTDAELVTTGTTWADIDDLSVDIEPTRASSKIFIMADIAVGSGNSYDTKIRLYRGTTHIYVGANGGSDYVLGTKRAQPYSNNYDYYKLSNIPIMYLDSPTYNLGDTLTYKLGASSYSNIQVFVNRTSTWTASGSGSNYDGTCASAIAAWEVGA